MIRLSIPDIDEREADAVLGVLRSGYFVQGPQVAAFEAELAQVVGARHAVAVSSGTAALHLALLAAGVGAGDLVLTTAYSWPATANAIEICGAQPVFVDIDERTFNIDCDALAATCRRLMADRQSRRRLKAILPVHAFGQPVDMEAICALGDECGLAVIEDAACALGAAWAGRPAGSWGQMGCFSFHPRKAITTGEGGLVATDDDVLADRLRALRNHGLDPHAAQPEFILPGYNYRMTEIAAALGRVQLTKLPQLIAMRRELARRYDDLLADTPLLAPAVAPGADAVCQSYVARVNGECVPIDHLIAAMRAGGVEVTIGTYQIPLTRYYRERYGHQPGDFPAADRVRASALSLPLHQQLTPVQQKQVVDVCLTELQRLDAEAFRVLGESPAAMGAVS